MYWYRISSLTHELRLFNQDKAVRPAVLFCCSLVCSLAMEPSTFRQFLALEGRMCRERWTNVLRILYIPLFLVGYSVGLGECVSISPLPLFHVSTAGGVTQGWPQTFDAGMFQLHAMLFSLKIHFIDASSY